MNPKSIRVSFHEDYSCKGKPVNVVEFYSAECENEMEVASRFVEGILQRLLGTKNIKIKLNPIEARIQYEE